MRQKLEAHELAQLLGGITAAFSVAAEHRLGPVPAPKKPRRAKNRDKIKAARKQRRKHK